MLKIEVKKPVALWYEIRKLIDNHHFPVHTSESFIKHYPEIYHIYLGLGLNSNEVKAERQKIKASN